MALTPMGNFTFDHADQADTPSLTPTQLKDGWDSRGEELKTVINNLIDALEADTDSSSGADQIGMTAITETGAAVTVQAVIEALITRLKAVTDSASGADLIGATAITDLTGATVQAILEFLGGKFNKTTGHKHAGVDGDSPKITSDGIDPTVAAVSSGTFTPILKGYSTAGTNTYTEQYGGYTKIGSMVFCVININLSALDPSLSGLLYIDGLPFEVKGDYLKDVPGNVGRYANINLPTGKNQLVIWATGGNKYISLGACGSGVTHSVLSHTALTNTSFIELCINYETS
jgi:hypothetical protein